MSVESECVGREVYNFSPGPAGLPREVMEQVQAEFLDYRGSGVSVVEISHRSPTFKSIAAELHENMRRVLNIPTEYEILFIAGGAQGQFAGLPLNLLDGYDSAAYLVSGHWSRKAFQAASAFTSAVCVADSEDTGHRSIAGQSAWSIPEQSAYLYCCDNETVHGLMLSEPVDSHLPVVCDMTSSLLTRPVDWSRYGAVIASCQKNIAPAGMTVVIIRSDLLNRQARKETPHILNYQGLAKSGSMCNTPATFSWYVANLTCQWVIEQGGVEEMYRRCLDRSRLLYDAIDASDFYLNEIEHQNRSDINVVFQLKDESLESAFLEQAEADGLLSLKGHRIVGGLRANLYNSMPQAGVEKLVAFMKRFESQLAK